MDEKPAIPEPRRFDALPDEDRLMLLDELIQLGLLDKSLQVTPEGEAVIAGEAYTPTPGMPELIGTDIKLGRIELTFELKTPFIKRLVDLDPLESAFTLTNFNVGTVGKAIVYLYDTDAWVGEQFITGEADAAD